MHLGDIDPFGVGRFGYALLVGINFPRTVVEVEESDSIEVKLAKDLVGNKEAENEIKEIRKYSERVLTALGFPGARISLISRPPRHYGLGSTTQLSLSVGLGISLVYKEKTSPLETMKILRRTSAGGVYTFQNGGFVLAGGFNRPRKKYQLSAEEEFVFPPLILRKKFPENWKFVLAWPKDAPPGPNDEDEEAAFNRLQSLEAPEKLIHKVYYLVNSKLVPSVLERNPRRFGEALTKIQSLVGRIYSPVQENIYNPVSEDLIAQLEECDESLGVGQSSWGPAVYSFTSKEDAARKMVEKIRDATDATVHIVKADNKGRQVTKLKS